MPYYQNPERIPTIAEALENQSVDQLKQLLVHLPTPKKAARKAELVSLFLEYLNGDNLHELWEKLDRLQQAAVAEVVHSAETQFDAVKFNAKYGQLPNLGKTDYYGSNRQSSLLGLFFYSYHIMPDELKERLEDFVPPPIATKISTVAEMPETIQQKRQDFDPKTYKSIQHLESIPLVQREMERTAQQDLMAVLRLINAGKVAVSDKTSHPTAATVKTITSILSGGDYYIEPEERQPYEQAIGAIRAFAWSLTIQAAGLAQLTGKKLSLTKAGQKALADAPEKTLRTTWQKWVKNKLFDELRRIDAIKGQTGKGQRGLTATEKRRQPIAIALADCPVNSWVDINDFLRYILAAGYDFEVTRQIDGLYICEAHYGTLYDRDDAWDILQARYILCLLFEYAATLGMIDVAYTHPSGARPDYRDFWGADDLEFFSRYDGLRYFRLTPLGAYCLGITDKYTPAPMEVRPVLRVLPNLEIAAIGEPLSAADVLILEIYTEKVSDAVWRLERGKLLSAIAEGQNLSILQELLQAKSGNPLPETVKQFLADIETRGHSLKDKGTARVIECADAALAVLIANDSRTKAYCMLAGERCLMVPTASETKFRNALMKLGYSLPK